MITPWQELHSDIRDPAMQSMTYPVVLESVTFKRRDMPIMSYTTHLRIWKKGRIVLVMEFNDDNDKAYAGKLILEFSEKTDMRQKTYKHTKHGTCWAFKCDARQLFSDLEQMAEAIYRPHAVGLQLIQNVLERGDRGLY